MANGTTLQTTAGVSAGYRQLELISGNATLDSISGVTHQQNGLVYGAGGILKTGTGTEMLTAANTYSGGTTINAGTLQINNTTGSGTRTGTVAVNTRGTLSGLPSAAGFATAGTISGVATVNSGGNLQARSGGSFTFGGLTLNRGSASWFELRAPTLTPIINITGSNAFSIAGATAINLSNIGGVPAGT